MCEGNTRWMSCMQSCPLLEPADPNDLFLLRSLLNTVIQFLSPCHTCSLSHLAFELSNGTNLFTPHLWCRVDMYCEGAVGNVCTSNSDPHLVGTMYSWSVADAAASRLGGGDGTLHRLWATGCMLSTDRRVHRDLGVERKLVQTLKFCEPWWLYAETTGLNALPKL